MIPIPTIIYNFFKSLIIFSFLSVFLAIPIDFFWGPIVIYGHPFTLWLLCSFVFWLSVFISVNFRPFVGRSLGANTSSGSFVTFFFFKIVLTCLLIAFGYFIVYLPLNSRLIADVKYSEPLAISFQARESDHLYFEIVSGRQTLSGTNFNLILSGPNFFSTSTKMTVAKKSGSSSSSFNSLTETRFSKFVIPASGSYSLMVSRENGVGSIKRIRILAR
jgi:hypothetical protein